MSKRASLDKARTTAVIRRLGARRVEESTQQAPQIKQTPRPQIKNPPVGGLFPEQKLPQTQTAQTGAVSPLQLPKHRPLWSTPCGTQSVPTLIASRL